MDCLVNLEKERAIYDQVQEIPYQEQNQELETLCQGHAILLQEQRKHDQERETFCQDQGISYQKRGKSD